jgi:OmpA-like transmembrane domain
MSTFIRIATALGMASMLLAASAFAADSGLYLGAGAGKAQTIDHPPQTGGELFDEASTSYRAFGGYRLGVIPFLDFAGELGYTDLGSASGSVAGVTAEYKTQGVDGSVLVIVPILFFDVYGRLGAMQYQLNKTFNGATTSSKSDGTAGVYGVGVGLRFWKMGVRLEYNRIDIPEVNSVDVASTSAYFQF